MDVVALVFTREADALAARQAIADALGYPVHAIATGSGDHVDDAASLFYSDPIRHPGGTRWAIVVDDVIAPLVPSLRAELPALADPVTLDATWFPLA